MLASELTPGHIGRQVTVELQNGLGVRGTLTSLTANENEDNIRVFFKELTDTRGQRLPVHLNYNDEVEALA